MKIITFLTILLLLQGAVTFGQQTRTDTLSPYAIVTHPDHCIATRVGEGVIIGSGVVLIAGVWSASPANKTTIAVASLGGIVVGAIVLICGKTYEHNHKGRFTVKADENRLGLVYNF